MECPLPAIRYADGQVWKPNPRWFNPMYWDLLRASGFVTKTMERKDVEETLLKSPDDAADFFSVFPSMPALWRLACGAYFFLLLLRCVSTHGHCLSAAAPIVSARSERKS